MEELEINNLLDLNETIATEIFEECKYPWEVLDKIENFIIKLGKLLDNEIYTEIKENVWIAKTASIANSACIEGPCIIDENSQVRHSAYIRKNVIIGKDVVVRKFYRIKKRYFI